MYLRSYSVLVFGTETENLRLPRQNQSTRAKIITNPMIGPDQFILAAVTGNSVGKQSQMITKMPYTDAAPFTHIPHRPSVNGVCGRSSPVRRCMNTKRQGIV